MTTPVVTLIEKPRGMLRRYAWRYSKKKMGDVADPLKALAHHGGVLVSNGALEMAVEKGWTKLDHHLQWLAQQATSGQIGCSWCMDFGYYEGMQSGVDPRKVRDVPRWRTSDVYDERERIVLEYAETATATPVQLGDDLVARMHEQFTDEEIVELVAWVALENYRSRINAGLGLHSQGYSAKCDLAPSGV